MSSGVQVHCGKLRLGNFLPQSDNFFAVLRPRSDSCFFYGQIWQR